MAKDTSVYVEEDELATYLWRNYPLLIDEVTDHLKMWRAYFVTGLEKPREAQGYIKGDEKYFGITKEKIAEFQKPYTGGEGRRRLARNVFEAHKLEIFLNRCPECSKIVIGPGSERCCWCGHTWYGENPHRQNS